VHKIRSSLIPGGSVVEQEEDSGEEPDTQVHLEKLD